MTLSGGLQTSIKTAAAEAWIRKHPDLPVPAKFKTSTKVFPPPRSLLQRLRNMQFSGLQAELGDLIRGAVRQAAASEIREAEADSSQVKTETSVDLSWN